MSVAITTPKPRRRLPEWLRRTLPVVSAEATHEILSRYRLNTVCESARCPNRSECYSSKTATFMILGNACTRRCGFCSVPTGKGETLEADEPERVAKAAKALGLEYVVITSVARDDLADEGAAHFAKTIAAVKVEIPHARVEVLTPDFHARPELLQIVNQAKPDVFNHNLETVRRLQSKVRIQANYERSLEVLSRIKVLNPSMMTKSGLMLGLGETDDEVREAARDLRAAGCDLLTLGQYLPPGQEGYLPVERYVSPHEFKQLSQQLKGLGFLDIFAGPYVRSSYHAGESFLHAEKNQF